MTPLLLNEIKLRFCQENIPRIKHCLDMLPEDRIRFKSNENCNAIANLVLHLNGNCRQWLLQNVFEEKFKRNRKKEFTAEEVSRQELIDLLDKLSQDIQFHCTNSEFPALEKVLCIQGIDTSVLGAVIHAIEHFSYHTGQIALLTKQSLNKDLGFYSKNKSLDNN